MNGHRGFSIVGLVVALVVLGLIAFGVMYFASDVFKTKTDAAYEQFAKWTPENIAKDPVNYLNFCEKQTKEAAEKLKASEIAIAQRKGTFESKRDDLKSALAVGRKALDELKPAYKKADADNAWPLAWGGRSMDKAQAQKQILKLAGDIESTAGMMAKYEDAITQLTNQAAKVQDAKDKAKEQLAKIETNREMLKVQQITDELKNSLVAMKGVIETSVVGVAASDSGPLSLADIKAKSDTAVDESKFNEIMGK